MGKTKTNEEYLQSLKERNITKIIPKEKYISARTKINHECTVCGYEWKVMPNNVLSGYGCPVCSHQIIAKGYNDLWTTHPDIAKLLFNKDDGYKYGIGSAVKLDFICPDCGKVVKNKTPSNVFRYGLSCSNCNDGLSIPNKFISNILSALEVDFEAEKIFEWSDGRRYDFYFVYNENSYILEANGMQHYSDEGFKYCGGRNLEEELANDEYKKSLAKENKINHYIVLDCSKSELEHMKNSIIISDLCNIFNFEKVDFKECYEKSLKSKVIECIELWNNRIKPSDICNQMKISNSTFCEYLHRGNELGLCRYEGFNERLKPVRCITTNKVFESIKSASIYYNIKGQGHIRDCCNGKRNYCGQDEYGNKLKWEFISKSDYEKLVA